MSGNNSLARRHDPAVERMLSVFPLTNESSRSRFKHIAMSLRASPELKVCTPRSVLIALWNCAAMGLIPNTSSGHAYVLGYKNRKANISEAKVIIGYQGWLELARRSGLVGAARGAVVYEGDEFTYDQGAGGYPHHIDARLIGRTRGKAKIAAYAVVEDLRGGPPHVRVIFPEDWARAKGASSTGNRAFGPWETDEDAMILKTAFHRLAKWLPRNPEMDRAVELEERFERTEAQALGDEEIVQVEPLPASDGKFGFKQEEPEQDAPPADDGFGEEMASMMDREG